MARTFKDMLTPKQYDELIENAQFRRDHQIDKYVLIDFEPVVRLASDRVEDHFLITELVGENDIHSFSLTGLGEYSMRPSNIAGVASHPSMKIDTDWVRVEGKTLKDYWEETAGKQKPFEKKFDFFGELGGRRLYREVISRNGRPV